ncbi:MAG: hypothetical protein QOD72_2547 [Acidimicrobiaceae bacterium]|nr:hypothetical protein [Acidimicrobiaceae bacterium]
MIIGLEHEYEIQSRGRQLDARELLPELDLTGRRLDPGDPHAIRLGWGGVITTDGREIEVATPPLALRPGAIDEALNFAAIGRTQVVDALVRTIGDGFQLTGFSTHISVSVPDEIVVEVGRMVLRHFAPALMLLLDAATSPGLLVRPRHGRLEIGGEYADGDPLAAAMLVAIGATLACCRARRGGRPLPPALRVTIAPAGQRFGWYVDRSAFGGDLYAEGVRTLLHPMRGRAMTAADHLRRSVAIAHNELVDHLDDGDLVVLDHIDPTSLPRTTVGPVDLRRPRPPAPSVHGEVLDDIVRPGFVARPVVATWDLVAFEFTGAGARTYAKVPADRLAGYLDDLRKGRLDDQVVTHLSRGAVRPASSRH